MKMWEVKCCICKEITTSPYDYIQHLENGKLRIYEGHKSCLFSIESRLIQGEQLHFTETNSFFQRLEKIN